MGGQYGNYIYDESIIVSYVLVLAIIYSLFNKKFMVYVALIMILVRPSEKYMSEIPIMSVLFISMILSFIVNIRTIIKNFNNTFDKLLAIYIFYILVATTLFHKDMLLESMKFLFTGFLYYVFCKSYFDNARDYAILKLCIIMCCFCICIEPLYYHVFEPQGSIYWKLFHSYDGRLQAWGMWNNANETAFIACIGIASLLLLTTATNKKILYIISLIIIPFFVFVIYLTASRAGLLCLLILFLPLIYLVKKIAFKLLAIVLIVILIILSNSYSPARTDEEASTEERIELYHSGIQGFEEYPFLGVGFLRARNELGGRALHDTYLQVFLETGIVGGIIFFCFMFSYIKKIYLLNRKTNKLIYSSIIYGFLISSLMYFLIGNQLLTIMFFVILSIISTSSMLFLVNSKDI